MLLFVLAAGARVQNVDLAPFAASEAAELDRARTLATSRDLTDWLLPSANLGLPTQIHALSLHLSDRAATWIAVLAILDAVAVVIVFFAAHSLAGWKAATVASALYVVSPWAWLAAHDAAPKALPVLAAAGLLVSIGLMRRGQLRDAVLLGVVGGLLLRVDLSHWSFLVPILATLALARCTYLVGVAGTVACALVGTPALLHGWDTLQNPSVEPVALDSVGDILSGMTRLGSTEIAALACGALLTIGGSVVAIRGWREESRQVVLPLLWIVAPAASLGALSGASLTALLPSLLPAGAILLSLAVSPGDGRWHRWVSRAALVASIVLLGAMTSGLTRLMARHEGSVAAPGLSMLVAGAEQDLGPTLRFWQTVADAASDAAERAETRELTVLAADGPFADSARVLQSLLAEQFVVRTARPGTIHLPLVRETIYLIPPGVEPRGEVMRPTARLAAIPADGMEATLRMVSLRPRVAGHWLAGVPNADEVRFEDGTVLMGAAVRVEDGAKHPTIELYWQFAAGIAAAASTVELATVAAQGGDRVARAALPEPTARREDEIVAARVRADDPSLDLGAVGTVAVRLRRGDGRLVPVVNGGDVTIRLAAPPSTAP